MSDGFIPIVSIFYAVFHPTEGTKIVHQFPEDLISTTSTIDNDSDTSAGLFNFDTVKNYVIPKPQLCNQLLSFKINNFKVIGYPVNMVNDHYARNSFNFNFCFVFNYELGDVSPYEPAIRRMGQMFQVLEEQNFLLSKLDKDNPFYKVTHDDVDTASKIDEFDLELYANRAQRSIVENDASVNAPGHSKTKRITLSSIESLIQQIYQDLNNYSECCIPLDTSNSVDIKLFPLLPPPINLKAYQVPIATVKLRSLVDVNWDPTMVKILPYIDGINPVKRISELADANYLVTKQCIQHLMHYKCIELIDIFQFCNIYSPTNRIGDFLKSDGRMAEQCQAYVVTNGAAESLRSSSFTTTPAQNSPKPMAESTSPSTFNFRRMPSSSTSPYLKQQNFLSRSPKSFTMQYANVKVPTKTSLFYLYRSLNQGQTVKEWYAQHRHLLSNIDIRRFINFGVLRGIIYRVYSYPVLNLVTRSIESGDLLQPEHILNNVKRKSKQQQHKLKFAQSSGGRGYDELLRTRVHEQTLKTDSNRRVSFSSADDRQPHYHEEPRKLSVMDEVVEEDDSSTSDESDGEQQQKQRNVPQNRSLRSHRTASSSGSNKPTVENEEDANGEVRSTDTNDEKEQEMIYLIKMLKGFQHFDSICTELQKSRTEVERMVEKLGSFSVINC
ncbi:NPR2 [Candida margitis]|uniref:NPR2 n=1 Tax=Candida margitis TaxID=1775924 RepID=UPI002227E995|nr:NPR2 [Candida margitis]KAI5970365.1 NPR2 [Candida margitis]